MGLRAARTPSHLVAPPPPQPPSFLITAAISSMAPAQHVTSLPWGGCAGGGGGGGRGVGGEAADGRLGAMENPPPVTSPPPAPGLHPRVSARGSRLHPSSPALPSADGALEICAPPPSRLSSPERQRCVSSGLGAALRCRRGGGFARRWTPPPRKAAPGGAGTAARRSCGAQGCGVRRTRVRLSVLPPRASRRASAPGFSMAPRPRPPPPPTKRSALTSPNPPPPLLIPLIPSGAVAACWLPAP